MTTLTQAHDQWARRAPDERFASLESMHAAAVGFRTRAAVSQTVKARHLRAIANDGAIMLQGPSGATAGLTNWAFGQLATKASAPAGYLQSLPAELAASALNHGLITAEGDTRLLIDKSDDAMTARALTSERYARIWNSDVTARLLDLSNDGIWQPAPAAYDGSRGLYLGDRDMFAFLVDNNRRIFEKGPEGGLSRGFFVWNSEVGAASVGVMTFLYEYVCGNHRVWGCRDVSEIRFRHVGEGLDRRTFGMLEATLSKYANASAADDEARIERMHTTMIGGTKDEVLDNLFNRFKLPKKTAEVAYTLAEQRVDWYGNPRSVWGIAGAITEIARDKPNANERDALNRIGAKVMEVVAF